MVSGEMIVKLFISLIKTVRVRKSDGFNKVCDVNGLAFIGPGG